MRPKQDLINIAIKDGSMDRVNMLLSAAHLLNCEANNLIEEASDVMIAKGYYLVILKNFIMTLSSVRTDILKSLPH